MDGYGYIWSLISAQAVAARLKWNETPDDETMELISNEIGRLKELAEPRVLTRRLAVTSVTENAVTLGNGVVLEGAFIAEKLSACRSVAVTVYTLGGAVDACIQKAFSEKEYVRALAADGIAVLALEKLGEGVWQGLAEEAKRNGLGLTERLSPGDGAFPVEEQRKLFACLGDTKAAGIALSDSCVMTPVKTVSAVYGFGDGIGIARCGNPCGECARRDCAYRNEELVAVTILDGENSETFQAAEGASLFEELRRRGFRLNAPCAGRGTCGKCKVTVAGEAPAPTAEERTLLTPAELAHGVRLACGVRVRGPMTVRLASQTSEGVIETAGSANRFPVDPPVMKKHVLLPNAAGESGCSELERLSKSLSVQKLTADVSLLQRLPATLRTAGGDVTATVFGSKLLALEPGNTENAFYGAAVDIGTTTVVCYLVELRTGRVLDTEGQLNRQSAYGADVLSRIHYTMEHADGAERLRSGIVGQLNEMLESLCKRCGVAGAQLCNLTVAGNTTMLHFLLGVPADGIAAAPFTPVFTQAMELDASALGLRCGGTVSILPGIASYVGGDITAGVLASGITDARHYELLLDLGTNGEIVLGKAGSLFACAVAAGPAFEGGNLRCGMAGVAGAVRRVDFGGGKLYETIGGGTPGGICGSGVLDIVAQMLQYGVIDESGAMRPPEEIADRRLAERITGGGGKRSFVLEPGGADFGPIVFTQKDVREVQLAKAAVAAGIRILMRKAGVGFDEIGRVLLAGGFGSALNVESAAKIGLIPSELRENATAVGNAAGAGAQMFLLSKEARREAQEAVSATRYIELSGRADFQDYFMEEMPFGGHWEEND